jgi:cysteine synthase A
MSRIYQKVTELVGRTPLVEINNIAKEEELKARLLVKVEFFNPGGSVKDRIALAMVEDAENKGLLKEKGVIIEPTSGNTGVGLAWVAAVKGYKLFLTMPESMSVERRNLLKSYGAELVLTPASEGMKGAIAKAQELKAQYPGSIIMGQFDNPANPAIHTATTAQEIWQDTDGRIDIFVAGVGTGGTLSGVSEGLKKLKPTVKTFAVEPSTSAVLSGEQVGPHKIQGIGAGFIPKNFRRSATDGILKVSTDEAIEGARMLARKEGLLVGISSGASFRAALALAKQEENAGKMIVALLPDTGERYLSMGVLE